jgi:hypothetical protein
MRSKLMAWTWFFLAIVVTGCQHSSGARSAAAPSLPPPPASGPVLVRGICDVDPASCGGTARNFASSDVQLAGGLVTESYGAQSLRHASSLLSFGAGSSTPQAPRLPSGPNGHGPHEMIEVEARFAIQSDDLARSATRFRELARKGGGTITLDTESLAASASEATFEVRVPMAEYDSILVALESVGSVRAREVKATDVAKQFHDEELLLSNQEAAMKRYEELLKDAKNVTEVMAVEAQLDRLRAQIDRLEGDLAWMEDKVARATIRVRIYATDEAALPVEPVAAVYPGVRFVTLLDLRSDSQRYGYAGAGLSLAFRDAFGIHFGRALVLELDVAHAAFTTPSAPSSDYAFLALVGSDFYSDRLGGGRRRFMNLYLGWRLGYAESEGRGDLAVGGVIGLDLVKTKTASIDLNVRAVGLVGNDVGPHAAIAPGLGANVAF